MTRVFRGVTYRIEVRNPQGVMKGVRHTEAGAVSTAGSKIPLRLDAGDDGAVRVIVHMGP